MNSLDSSDYRPNPEVDRLRTDLQRTEQALQNATRRTYIDDVLAGKATAEQVDSYIHEWHNQPAPRLTPLAAWLGFTLEEYSFFVRSHHTLPAIIANRIALSVPADVNHHLAARLAQAELTIQFCRRTKETRGFMPDPDAYTAGCTDMAAHVQKRRDQFTSLLRDAPCTCTAVDGIGNVAHDDANDACYLTRASALLKGT